MTGQVQIVRAQRLRAAGTLPLGDMVSAIPREKNVKENSRLLIEDCTDPGESKAKTFNDALTAAKTALSSLTTANTAAQKDADDITAALAKVTVDEAMVQKFSAVLAILKAGVDTKDGRFGPLKAGMESLSPAMTKLNSTFQPFKPCVDADAPPAAVKKILDDYKSFQTSVSGVLTDDKKSPKALKPLTDAVKSIGTNVNSFLGLTLSGGEEGLAGKAAGAASVSQDLPSQALRRDLPKRLQDLATAITLRYLFEQIAEPLMDGLDPKAHRDLSGVVGRPDFQTPLNGIDASLIKALAKVPAWARRAQEDVREELDEADKVLVAAERDPTHNTDAPLARAAISDPVQRGAAAMVTALQSIIIQTKKDDFPGTILPSGFAETITQINQDTKSLQSLTAQLGQKVLRLNADIQTDKSTWTMANIDLFYFDDVIRLMRVLAPKSRKMGGDESLHQRAIDARNTLLLASQSFEGAQRVVENSRKAVADAKEELRLATGKVDNAVQRQQGRSEAANKVADEAEADAARKKTDRGMREAELTEIKSKFSRNEAKADQVDAVQRKVDEAKVQEAAANDLALKKRAVANGTSTSQEVIDLQAKVTKADLALTTATTTRDSAGDTLNTALQTSFLTAQAENFAYAQARDNTPFWTNLPEPIPPPAPGATAAPIASVVHDTDPISRVVLFAFPDSRTLFVRGQQDDVDLVRQIVKEFDQPQGQAMMTLRTLEINSDGTEKGVGRALETLETIDKEIRAAQDQIEDATTKLRNAINKQVSEAVTTYGNKLQEEVNKYLNQNIQFSPGGSPADCSQMELITDNRIKNNCIAIENSRARLMQLDTEPGQFESIAFYDKDVMTALGWRGNSTNRLQNTAFLNAVIPRPSHTVTLAHALIIVSLTTNESRKKIVENLPSKKKGVADAFASLRRFLGTNGDSADILALQSKLIEALRFNGITHVLESVEARIRAQIPLEQARKVALSELVTIRRAVSNQTAALEDQRRVERNYVNLNNNFEKAENDLNIMLEWLQGNTAGYDIEGLKERIKQEIGSQDSTRNLLLQAVGLRRSARYRFSQANESAVNLTFRKYLQQVNDDLNDAYVKPVFRKINRIILEAKLGVGIIQQTSILASNRLGARVDPRGSAQLAVGEEKNLLEAAQQLTNLFGIAARSFVTGGTGNPTGLVGGAASASNPATAILSGARSVFSALDQMPRDAKPAVYGIATGNLFEVTPIIDPSGQALRFRFDFVSSTQIREPNNSIDPQLPRIERHTVNTEVQLANQEIRLISQFEANSRLGIPTTTSGGIPVLKYIPGLRKIPFIGWFVKRSGRNGETQQSFIFCQTEMYPTLGEVLDLIVQAPTFTGLEN